MKNKYNLFDVFLCEKYYGDFSNSVSFFSISGRHQITDDEQSGGAEDSGGDFLVAAVLWSRRDNK